MLDSWEKMVAAEPGVEHAPLFYKPLEKVKENELKQCRGNYDAVMNIPVTVRPSLLWWITNLPEAYKVVSHGQPSVIIYTDSSKSGWGAWNKLWTLKRAEIGLGGTRLPY